MKKKFILWLAKLLGVKFYVDEPNIASVKIVEQHYEPIVLKSSIRVGFLEDSRYAINSSDYLPFEYKKQAAINQIKKNLFDSIEVDIKMLENPNNPYSIEIVGELIICKPKIK
jgi:hypothetical protein